MTSGIDTSAMQTQCRVCQAPFYAEPLLELAGMPAAAQNFPDAAQLESDHGVDLVLCQCQGCGLVQLQNPPVAYYKDVIRASAFSEEMRDFRLAQFDEFVSTHKLSGKKVLELGCGKGEYLSLMKASGVKAYGLEHLDSSVIDCHGQGLDVAQGYPDSPGLELDDGPFDAFFILNFFEHLPDPNTALRVMANNLNDDGIGLVEVPNFDAIVEKKLFSEFINDHLFYFSEATLASTLNYNGFEVLEVQSIWYEYILSATVRKKRPMDLSLLSEYQHKIAQEIHAYLDSRPDKKCAIWGAGHQALAVIALSDLSDRIEIVVDSAPFKQNKFTPATHLPVRDPAAIDQEEVELIIVMAAGYSDEVVRLIEDRYPTGGRLVDVAVLREFGLEIVRS